MALVRGLVKHERDFKFWFGQNQEIRPLMTVDIASLWF